MAAIRVIVADKVDTGREMPQFVAVALIGGGGWDAWGGLEGGMGRVGGGEGRLLGGLSWGGGVLGVAGGGKRGKGGGGGGKGANGGKRPPATKDATVLEKGEDGVYRPVKRRV